MLEIMQKTMRTSRNRICFSIIVMPEKSHFTSFTIQNFVQNTKKRVNSIYIIGIMFARKMNGV